MQIMKVLSKALKFTFSSWMPWLLALTIVVLGIVSESIQVGAARAILSSSLSQQLDTQNSTQKNTKTDNVLPPVIQSLFDDLGVSDANKDANKAKYQSYLGNGILIIAAGLFFGYFSMVGGIGIDYLSFEDENKQKVGLVKTLKYSFKISWRFVILVILGAILAFVSALPFGFVKGLDPSMSGTLDSIWIITFAVFAGPALMIADALVIVCDLTPGKAFREAFKLAYTRILETIVIFLPVVLIETIASLSGQTSFVKSIPWWVIALISLPWMIILRAYVIKSVKQLVEIDKVKPKRVIEFV